MSYKVYLRSHYHDSYLLGVVFKVNNESLNITLLKDKKEIILTKSSMDWALNNKHDLSKQFKTKI